MRYSVIIPVYNAESTLRRCLDSILQQTYNQAEIILINDGSTDRSGQICLEYANQHSSIKYIEQVNSGASSARNAGLEIATGEYITFVDSDDYVLDGYFSALDSVESDFVVFSYQAIRNDGVHAYEMSQNLKSAKNNTEIILNVLRDRLAGPVNKRFLRAILKENDIRFKSDLIIGEDFIFGLEYMLCCHSSQVIDIPLYCVDETGTDSITRSARYDLSQFVVMYKYAFDVVKNCNWPQNDKERLIQLLDYLYCRTAFSRTEYCLREKEQAWAKASGLITMFQRDYHPDILPLNWLHRFMRWCVKRSAVPVFFLVGYAHIVLQKK